MREALRNVSNIPALSAMSFVPLLPVISERRYSFSRIIREVRSIRSSTICNASTEQGFRRKSAAPERIACTAVSTVP